MKKIITKTDYVNFIGRNANAACCACYDRLVYELCLYVYTRVSSSSNKANSLNRICTSFIYLLLFLAITMGVYACARVCVIICGGCRLYRASVSGRECNRSTNSTREQDVDGVGEMVVVDGKKHYSIILYT